MLTRLKVKNFKALKDLDIRLRERNVFIGRNNSGKSTILHALSAIGRMLISGDVGAVFGGAAGFQEALWKGGSEQDMLFEIWGDDKPLASDGLPTAFHYSISITLDQQKGPMITQERLHVGSSAHELSETPVIDAARGSGIARHESGETIFTSPPSTSKPFLSYEIPGWRADRIRKYITQWQFFQLNPEIAKQTVARPAALPFLDVRGTEISGWLHMFQANYPEVFNRILSVAKEAFPEIVSLATPVTQAGTTFLASTEKDLQSPVSISYASDGEVKFLQLLSIIFSPFDVGLVAIEEPESYLHPRLIELLVEAADNVQLELGDNQAQVFVTTHSPFLVDKLKPEDVVVVDKILGKTVCTRAEDKTDIRRMLEEGELSFGRLWYSGALGGV